MSLVRIASLFGAFVVAACGSSPPAAAPGRPDVEAKLGAVHDRFHALAEHH